MNESRARSFFPLGLKALVIVLGLLGQFIGFRRSNFMSGAYLLYYTNISNCLIVLLSGILLGLELRSVKAGQQLVFPAWLSRIRFILTSGILLTFAVFSLLLMPLMRADYLLSPDNLLVHNLVPLLACLDFILFDLFYPPGKHRILSGLILPLAYLLFVIILSLTGQHFDGRSAPYFFLDTQANGWFSAGNGRLGVFWWLLIISLLQLVLSRLLLGLRKLASRHSTY